MIEAGHDPQNGWPDYPLLAKYRGVSPCNNRNISLNSYCPPPIPINHVASCGRVFLRFLLSTIFFVVTSCNSEQFAASETPQRKHQSSPNEAAEEAQDADASEETLSSSELASSNDEVATSPNNISGAYLVCKADTITEQQARLACQYRQSNGQRAALPVGFQSEVSHPNDEVDIASDVNATEGKITYTFTTSGSTPIGEEMENLTIDFTSNGSKPVGVVLDAESSFAVPGMEVITTSIDPGIEDEISMIPSNPTLSASQELDEESSGSSKNLAGAQPTNNQKPPSDPEDQSSSDPADQPEPPLDSVDQQAAEEEQAAPEEDQASAQCFWMMNVAPYDWIANGIYKAKVNCKNANKGCGSGGACYKWAECPTCPRL